MSRETEVGMPPLARGLARGRDTRLVVQGQLCTAARDSLETCEDSKANRYLGNDMSRFTGDLHISSCVSGYSYKCQMPRGQPLAQVCFISPTWGLSPTSGTDTGYVYPVGSSSTGLDKCAEWAMLG